jgi:type IV secretory pathway TraG/TraD family ATPase VirD4
MIDDINYGKGLAVIDPHGDLIDEIMMHIPEHRKDDVIIFDPTDEKFPFCFNPLTV